jgi:proteasome activator subunit 4
LAAVKARTYAKSDEEIWLEEWNHPLSIRQPIENPAIFLKSLDQPIGEGGLCVLACRFGDFSQCVPFSPYFVDKIQTGFLTWTPSIECYAPPGEDQPPLAWISDSSTTIAAMGSVMTSDGYFDKLALLWGQDSNRNSGTAELRGEHVAFMKTLG